MKFEMPLRLPSTTFSFLHVLVFFPVTLLVLLTLFSSSWMPYSYMEASSMHAVHVFRAFRVLVIYSVMRWLPSGARRLPC